MREEGLTIKCFLYLAVLEYVLIFIKDSDELDNLYAVNLVIELVYFNEPKRSI